LNTHFVIGLLAKAAEGWPRRALSVGLRLSAHALEDADEPGNHALLRKSASSASCLRGSDYVWLSDGI
jgi:hypothetical protein